MGAKRNASCGVGTVLWRANEDGQILPTSYRAIRIPRARNHLDPFEIFEARPIIMFFKQATVRASNLARWARAPGGFGSDVMGIPRGNWEGDHLVVDTIGTTISLAVYRGHPHSDALHMWKEPPRGPEPAREYQHFDDPKTYTDPEFKN